MREVGAPAGWAGRPAASASCFASQRACFSTQAEASSRPAGSLAVNPHLAPSPPAYRLVEGRRITEKYEVAPSPVFAVVELSGTQFKVTPGDVLVVERLNNVDVQDIISLDRVLLLGSQSETLIGRPHVPGARVLAAVEEHFLNGKVLIFHKRRRKNSRRLKGHRQPLSSIRILEVQGIDP
ncbi:hypothetical protein H632_c505p0 [Helicosporidium sp. ATCC 50920]|nr:hypothetical protein H632_c505p0 [Helicosporidium sp. ATCC 50920]|eukprot:KDD75771.1 hypothetical protein H632_c505p0 [Helicosporidium sp. ATCC 50920]